MIADDTSRELPFWKTRTLEDMTQSQWESLCDGCARCCLNKLEDWDTGEIVWTDVACTLLDGTSCRCKDYENRASIVPDCISGDPETVHQAGISVRGRTIPEDGMALEDYEHHVVFWPGEVPEAAQD